MFKIYSITLTLKSPSDIGRKINFYDKENDINYAINSFNDKYPEKKLRLLSANSNSIILLLKLDMIKNATAKDLSYFSKRLYHDKGWEKYSKIPTKLFVTSKFDDVTTEYEKSFESIEKTNHEPQNYITAKNSIPSEIDEYIDNFSDDDAITSFTCLIQMQNIGSNSTISKRKSIIKQIKKLLYDALN